MEFIDVSSTMIDKVAYDNTHGMCVKFKTGPLYIFPNVPKTLFDEFLDSDSKGKFFTTQIKNKYSFSKEGEQ